MANDDNPQQGPASAAVTEPDVATATATTDPVADVEPAVSPPLSPAPFDEGVDPITPADTDDFESDEFDPQDVDSASLAASTSVTSSIFNHSWENGRRVLHNHYIISITSYHSYKNARYPIPNDDIEQNREDMKHALMLELTDGGTRSGKLFFAPIGDNPQKIIDLGTGTGIWAIEVADQYPSAQVEGIDFSPIQPVWVPPNVKFIVDNIEDDWLNGSDFDLVHLRQMAPFIKNLDKVLRQSYENIKPGGWIEMQDLGGMPYCDDGSVPEDYSVKRFTDLCQEAMGKFGSDFQLGNRLEEPLIKAGFVNVSCKRFKVPLGTWAKDKRLRLIGLYFKTVIEPLTGAMAAKPFPALGMSDVEIQVFLAGVRKDMANTNYHAYFEYLFWTGQKPY
ncbi:S-adenosyl-L-methionine-dependent methyltransferase [Bombardia bombarda]|uniref:S-adenosyl-L-methionine-dependent methyltransferase n=1 Tax=Bombardia bombarda TaxID=252184 RepID=A0AA40C4Q1_9PEZI|nr:S-adenosyl-L-methionine-dependent methyltransferase [Bombardia bombarda]